MITNREIEAKDVKRLLLRVYKRYSSRAMTESKAYKETYILNSVKGCRLRGEITNLRSNVKRLNYETDRYRKDNKGI